MNIIEEKIFLKNLYDFINKVPCENMDFHKYWKQKMDYLKKHFIIDDDLINNYYKILKKHDCVRYLGDKYLLNHHELNSRSQNNFNKKILFLLSEYYNF